MKAIYILHPHETKEVEDRCDGCGQRRLASELRPVGDGSLKACHDCYARATATIFTRADSFSGLAAAASS